MALQKFTEYRFNNAIYLMTTNQYRIYLELASKRHPDGTMDEDSTDWDKLIKLVEEFAHKKTDIRMEEEF